MTLRLICASHTPLMDHVETDPEVDRQVRAHFKTLSREGADKLMARWEHAVRQACAG